MARLVAVANGLYYPTPLRIIAGIADRLSLPSVSSDPQCTLRVLDPCAGRGSAALFLTRLLTLTRTGNAGLQDVGQSQNGSGAELFGIELDRTRAELAAPHFTRLLQTNTLSARVEQKAFDLILHNPPYHDSGDGDKRLEHSFLKRVTAYLKPGGVLLHIVPQSRLAISAEFLAHYYTDIEVLRFPLPEYEVFRQVVLLGVRREYALEDSRTARRLKSLAEAGPDGLSPLICPAQVGLVEKLVEEVRLPRYPEVVEELERLRQHPPLTEAGEDRFTSTLTLTPTSTPTNTATSTFSTSSIATAPQYLLPLSTANRPVSPFASTEYNPAQALAEARQNGVWANHQLRELVGEVGQGQGQRTSDRLGNREQAGILYRPLTPLREGQAAMLTAVGLLNNLVLEDEGGQRVLVKGRTFKEYRLRRIERDEDGSVKSRTEREVVRSQLTALDLQTGEATEIEHSDMAAFIERFGPSIRRQMLSNYPPLYLPGQAHPTTRQLEAGLTRLGRKPLGADSRWRLWPERIPSCLQRLCHLQCRDGVAESRCMGAAAAWLVGRTTHPGRMSAPAGQKVGAGRSRGLYPNAQARNRYGCG